MAKSYQRKFQTILCKYWPSFHERYAAEIPKYVHTVFTKVMLCRTEALGAHIYRCLVCGFTLLIKHSCKARFCSSCATAYIDKWAAKVKHWLSAINAEYYFVTFTIPKELKEIVKVNKRIGYQALFAASSHAILSFYQEKRVTGGIVSVLQTVGRTLNFHPHIHLLVTYGGLLFNQSSWKEVFLPAKVLQVRFKEHFLASLRGYYQEGRLTFPKGMHFDNRYAFNVFLKRLERKHWQLDRSNLMDSVSAAIAYTARYLGKPPLSEHRILFANPEKICFTYKDYLNKAVIQKALFPLDTFFFRLIHAVPLPRVPMMRCYGLFSTHSKKKLLKRAAELIPPPPGADLLRISPPKTLREHRLAKTGIDPLKCPTCQKDLELIKIYFPGSLILTTFDQLLEAWQKKDSS